MQVPVRGGNPPANCAQPQSNCIPSGRNHCAAIRATPSIGLCGEVGPLSADWGRARGHYEPQVHRTLEYAGRPWFPLIWYFC